MRSGQSARRGFPEAIGRAAAIGWLVFAGILGCARAAGPEPELRRVKGDAKTTLVVRDAAGTYWAFPGSGIKAIDRSESGVITVSLEPGTNLAVAKGNAPSEKIAKLLAQQCKSSGPSFRTFTDRDVSGQAGKARPGAIVDVKSIVLLEAER